MKLLGTIALLTPRVILRRITQDDAFNMYYNWTSDDEVTKYLTWNTHKSIENTKEVIKMWMEQYDSPYFYQWGIELKAIKQLIGTISLFNINFENKSCELGYCMGRKFWNQGLMTEACHYIINYAFKELEINAIYAKHDIDNPASGRVMEKNHMKYIYTKTEYSKKENKDIQLKYYQIKKEDLYEISIMEC